MKYSNIKAAKISHAQIAKAFGYASVNSFRCSSAHQRHMRGVEAILEWVNARNEMIAKLKKQTLQILEDMEESKWKPDSFGVNNLTP